MKQNKLILYITFLILLVCTITCRISAVALSPMPEFTFDSKSLAEYSGVEDMPDIEGYSAYAMNLDSGMVVFEKNSRDKVFPASTVKLMTAIVAFENIDNLDIEIEATSSAVRMAQGSNMNIKVGEVFTARQLLYGLLVKGANDAALVLAEYVSGSQSAFCELMNQKADQLGCKDTHYENVTGFHNELTVTTARDTGIIAQYFYYIPELFEMSNTTRYVFEPTELTKNKRTLINRNMLLSKVISQDYYYRAAKGMSQGSTPEGGECIVSCVTGKDNLTYLCVVMNSKELDGVNYACRDIVSLFKFCQNNFSMQPVVSKNDLMSEISVKNAVDVDHIALFSDCDIEMLLPNNMEYNKDITLEKRIFEDSANAPVNKGDVFGEIVVKYKSDSSIGRAKLVSNVAVDRSNVLYFFSRIEKLVTGTWFIVFFVVCVILFGFYFWLSVYYYKYSRKRKYSNKRYRR